MDLRITVIDENGDRLMDCQIYQDGSDSECAARIRQFIGDNFDVENDYVPPCELPR